MHGQRRKRWTNIDLTLGERLMFAGIERFSLWSDVFLSQLKPWSFTLLASTKASASASTFLKAKNAELLGLHLILK